MLLDAIKDGRKSFEILSFGSLLSSIYVALLRNVERMQHHVERRETACAWWLDAAHKRWRNAAT